MVKALFCLLCLAVSQAARVPEQLKLGPEPNADLITLKPQAGKSGADKILIIINGAYIENSHYAEVARSIQTASSLKLWIGIPTFVLNCPNPGEIDGAITGAIEEIKNQGFPGEPDHKQDVIVGGHSLGGIFSQSAVTKGGYGGLVLFGSYLTKSFGNELATYPVPVLTLAGELDGLTRITRIGREWLALQKIISSQGSAIQYKKPVIALPGQTHSQFCSGVNVTSFGTKDLRPEVSWEVAHQQIGLVVSEFLDIIMSTSGAASARNDFDRRLQYTGELLAGFLELQEEESSSFCGASQYSVAGGQKSSAGYTVDVDKCTSVSTFDVTYPSIAESVKVVHVVDKTDLPSNPADSSTTPEAAKEIECKLNSAKAITSAFGAHGTPGSCKTANDGAIEQAKLAVSTTTATRYGREGKEFNTFPDSVYSTGVTWAAASLDIKDEGRAYSVVSPVLTTDDYTLCKLLSPAAVAERMLVDGLPRFDEGMASDELKVVETIVNLKNQAE